MILGINICWVGRTPSCLAAFIESSPDRLIIGMFFSKLPVINPIFDDVGCTVTPGET